MKKLRIRPPGKIEEHCRLVVELMEAHRRKEQLLQQLGKSLIHHKLVVQEEDENMADEQQMVEWDEKKLIVLRKALFAVLHPEHSKTKQHVQAYKIERLGEDAFAYTYKGERLELVIPYAKILIQYLTPRLLFQGVGAADWAARQDLQKWETL